MKSSYSRFLSHSALRLVVSLFGIVVFTFCIWIAIRAGFSRVLGKYAMLTGNLAAADKAVALAASDADAHMIRATVLYHFERVTDAARELEVAVSLRPRDHSLWLQLAIIRDELHDSAGAATAFNEAIRLAPFYAYPTWQRGNFLLRTGRYEDAFADLRRAAASNPEYAPILVDLAWAISKGDTQLTEQLAGITTSDLRVAFARLLAKHGRPKEATEQIRLAGSVPDQTRRDLAQLLVAENAFKEAFEVWKKTAATGPAEPQPAAIHNASFEGPLMLNEMGFGWRVSPDLQGVRLAADSTQFQSGSKSLLIEFLGDSNPESPLVSQLMLVEPSRHYRVSFVVRAQDIVTGGLPFAEVTDAAGTGRHLSESVTLRQDTTDWQMLSLDFHTESTTSAVLLSVRRKNCPQSPCPIFGSLWLDSFSVEEMK